jgi:hypothetical protein
MVRLFGKALRKQAPYLSWGLAVADLLVRQSLVRIGLHRQFLNFVTFASIALN